jgi:hypothetical protein
VLQIEQVLLKVKILINIGGLIISVAYDLLLHGVHDILLG